MTQRVRKCQRRITTWISFILALTCTSLAEGQDGHRGGPDGAPSRSAMRVGIEQFPAELGLRLPAGSPPGLTGADVPQSADPSRSKVIAGAASGLIPGLGSFYASHVRHGLTHLTIHLVAGTLALAGSVSCITAWGGETDCNEGATQLVAATWLLNWGWSIVTAINDAGAFNARHSRP